MKVFLRIQIEYILDIVTDYAKCDHGTGKEHETLVSINNHIRDLDPVK